MTGAQLQRMVEGYWTYHRLASSPDRADRLAADEWWWAYEAVANAVASGGSEAVELIVALADGAGEDEDALASLGAGPIEDLLRHEGPPSPETADALDAAARQNAAVRYAVRCVWWSDDDDPEMVARFTRFGGAP